MPIGRPHQVGRTRLLIVTPDFISHSMAGIAVRHWEFARALSKEFEVTLVADHVAEVKPEGFEVVCSRGGEELAGLAAWSDVIFVQGDRLSIYPVLKEAGKPLIIDLICPNHLEELEQVKLAHEQSASADVSQEHLQQCQLVLDRNCEQLRAGDFFICGSENQKDFWLGMLSALDRINPHTYNGDQTMNSLLDIVPFGVPSRPPEQRRRVLKGVLNGIGEDDLVLLWNGGIWDWLDPLTVIHAVSRLSKRREDIKLVFMGARHPRPGARFPRMAERAFTLARELAVYQSSVFFNEDWIPYHERENFLLEADIGVYCQTDHLEARFAFRTRVLDCFWAGLPIISTRGDYLSGEIERHGMGEVVEIGNVEGWEQAILTLADKALRERCSANVKEYAKNLHWETVVQPIAEFCRHPRFAADKLAPLHVSQADQERQRAERLQQERDQALQRAQAMEQDLQRTLDQMESLEKRKGELQMQLDQIRSTPLYRLLHAELRDLKDVLRRLGRKL